MNSCGKISCIGKLSVFLPYIYYNTMRKSITLITIPVIAIVLIAVFNRKDGNAGLNRFLGSQICFPKDTPLPSDRQSATMVVYYNYATCATCMMKRISEWTELLDGIDSIHGFTPLFIFEPAADKRDEYLRELEHSALPYPVLSDFSREFHKTNMKIPSDTRYHIFLLDGNNNVVLAGNPMHNTTLWELYRMYVSELCANNGLLTEEFAGKAAKYAAERGNPANGLFFETTSIDAGIVGRDSALTVTFTAYNSTGSGIEIERILTDCDCTVASASSMLVAPHGRSIITTRMVIEDSGQFEHHIFVKTRNSGQETHLIVTGTAN